TNGKPNKARTLVNTEFFHDVGAMGYGGFERNAEGEGDLFCAHAFADQAQDFDFTGREEIEAHLVFWVELRQDRWMERLRATRVGLRQARLTRRIQRSGWKREHDRSGDWRTRRRYTVGRRNGAEVQRQRGGGVPHCAEAL